MTINIGVVGYRGSGKTTLSYKLCGLSPIYQPAGTESLNYLGCLWGDTDILIWDNPPGVSVTSQDILKDMNYIVVCVDGRNNTSSRNAVNMFVKHYKDAQVIVAVTRMSFKTWCVPFHLVDVAHVANVPTMPCYNDVDSLIQYIYRKHAPRASFICCGT